MGGKSSTSTQSVQIPPEVLARYNAVNQQAQQTAGTPFQTYSDDPNAFVAPMTPTQLAGMQNINYATGQAQPYYDQATDQLMGGQQAAVPFYQQAAGDISQGQDVGDLYNQMAMQAYYGGLAGATPYNLMAGAAYQGAGDYANPLQAQAVQNIGAAQDIGGQLAAASLSSQAGAGAGAAPVQTAALQNLAAGQEQGQGLTAAALEQLRAGQMAASPFYGLAGASIAGAPGAAEPLQGSAAQTIGGARAGAAPYQAVSTALGLAGARGVNPSELDSAAIGKYMSPYLSSVVAPTAALLNQQAQQAQSEQLGNAIRSGAFGGDRAGIVAANLNQQQQLAQGKVLGELLQQGYGQALGAAQQQQGVGLGAEQANRAAQASAAQQLLGIGQAGFGQDISSAQAQAALAQQIFGQQLGTGQAAGALAGQIFGQGATAAQQQQAAGQALFGQGATTAGQQAALAQQIFGQGMSQSQQQAALSQLLYGQGTGAAQQQAAIAQQLFGQGITGGQAMQGLGQQFFGQGVTGAQQQAAIGQQAFGQDLAAAQARQGLGQGLYGMGAGTSQAMAGLGAGAQQAALQGAQAQMAAGQIQQQTGQAGLQALYNQFLQSVAYPFQVSQFLANIAMGTGALSGSTTTTRQPGSILSDVRAKEDVRKVGETFDGQPIYSFRYKGQPQTQMGLMAQEVEKEHPEAVGLAGGLKTVNYDTATRDAAEMGKAMEGGRVKPQHAGMGFADGGLAGPDPMVAQRQADELRRQKESEDIKKKSEDMKQDAGLKPPQTVDVPKAQAGIPDEPVKTPELAVANGNLYSQDPRSQDLSSIASIAAAAAMMSDRRVKENIEHIGHTYDGQKIYSYNIKGEPATQIGLMADEVEKHHPEAVGRAKFADGGTPSHALGGLDLAQLIAAQAQMYGPHADSARGITGMPGGAGYVPSANLPVGELVTAPGLAPRPSSADDLEQLTNTAGSLYDLSGRVLGTPSSPTPSTPSTPTAPPQTTTTTTQPGSVSMGMDEVVTGRKATYRGGLARADGGPVLPYDATEDANGLAPKFMKAGGGQVMPYEPVNGIAIPTSMDIPELQTAGDLPAARSTMDDLKDIVNTGAQVYGMYKGATAPKPEDLQEVKIKSKRPGQMAAGGTPDAEDPERQQEERPAPPAAGLAPDPRAVLTAKNDAGVGGAPPTGLAPPVRAEPPTVPQGENLGTITLQGKKPPGMADRARGWLEKNKDLLFPVLTGAAAAAATPTENRISALLVGAGAAGRSYQDVQRRQAELEQTRAQTEQARALAEQTRVGTGAAIQSAQMRDQAGRQWVYFADGSRMLLGQYMQLSPKDQAKLPLIGQEEAADLLRGKAVRAPAVPTTREVQEGTAEVGFEEGPPSEGSIAAEASKMSQNAPLSGTRSWVGQQGQNSIRTDLQAFAGDDNARRTLRLQENQTVLKEVSDAAGDAYGRGSIINMLAKDVSKLPDGGVAAAGILSEPRRYFARAYNDILSTAFGAVGQPVPRERLIAEEDLTTGNAIDKLTNALTFLQSSGADQNSLAALREAAASVPNMKLDKASMQTLLAQMMVDKQRAIDMQNYMREAQAMVPTGMSDFVSMDNLRTAFRNEALFNDNAYKTRQEMVERLLRTPSSKPGESAFDWLRKNGQTPERINKYAAFLHYGPKRNAEGQIIRDANGDPEPNGPVLPGISNIIWNQ